MLNYNKDKILEAINLLSFVIGIENLQENREQSKHNDVQMANDKQAKFLLEEISKKFEEQNAILKEILNKLNKE